MKDDAEKSTGITQQQVSKWRNRLKDPEQYHAMLYGVAYHKAMAEGGNNTSVAANDAPARLMKSASFAVA